MGGEKYAVVPSGKLTETEKAETQTTNETPKPTKVQVGDQQYWSNTVAPKSGLWATIKGWFNKEKK